MSGVMLPRVIVVAHPNDYKLVGRVVERVLAPDYQWPEDNIASVCFHRQDQEPWQGRHFGVRRNKASITVYGPGDPA